MGGKIPEIERTKRDLKEWIMAAITLQDITVKIHGSTDMNEAMDFIIEATTRLLKVEYASIILVDLKKKKFLKSATNDPTRPKYSTWQYLRPNGLTFHVAKEREIVVIEDTDSHPLATNPMLKDLGIKSLLAVPVVSGDEVLGVFYALTTKRRNFDKFDIHLARNLAAHAATAIQNIRFKNELLRIAREDPLTGLLNRRAFMEQLEYEFHRFKRYGEYFALAVIDLDHLKQVNDTLGHQMGDHYIVSFAKVLSEELRKSDVPGRIGGDEFAAIMIKPDEGSIVKIFRRIQTAWERQAQLISFKPAFSVGVYLVKEDIPGLHVQDIFQNADRQLYNAKKHGRSSVSIMGTLTKLTE